MKLIVKKSITVAEGIQAEACELHMTREEAGAIELELAAIEKILDKNECGHLQEFLELLA